MATRPTDDVLAPDRTTLVRRASALRDRLRSDQAATEERTHYSAELHQLFAEAGFYRMYVPPRYGGLGIDVPTVVRVMIEIGRGSMQTAWGLCLTANHALQVASWFPREAQDLAFARGDFRAASVAAPTVTATRTPDGWRLDGSVAYCSGIPWSTWFLGQAMIAEEHGGDPTRMALYLAPRSHFTVLDDWGELLGLRGTGSNTIRFDGAVLDDRLLIEDASMLDFPVEHGTPGLHLHGDPLYTGRALFVFTASLAGPVVGGAYAALDEYAALMRVRSSATDPSVRRIDDPDHLRWYGAALARIATAEAALLHTAEEHMARCRDNAAGVAPYTRAEDFRLAAVAREAIVSACAVVTDDLLPTIGSGALHSGGAFARTVRDVAQVASHRNMALREPMYRMIAADDLGAESTG